MKSLGKHIARVTKKLLGMGAGREPGHDILWFPGI